MKPLTDSHLSGRFDATPDEWAAALADLAAADVFAGTEARGVNLAKLLPSSVDHYAAGDAYVGWHPERFKFLFGFPTVLTEKTWHAGPHVQHARPAAWVLLEDRDSRETLLRVAFHGPASIQQGPSWSEKPEDADNVAAARDTYRRVRRQLAAADVLLEPDHVTVSADWNADMADHQWLYRANHVVAKVPACKIAVPPAGTHHGRRIDAHATTLPVYRVQVAARRKGFDHQQVTILAR